jgi:L-lactate dehydrogenase complex protein LldG
MIEIGKREIILEKIKTALEQKSKVNNEVLKPKINSIFPENNNLLEITFAEEFNKINGKFVFCENFKEFTQNIRILFKQQKLNSVFCQDKAIQQILASIDVPFTSGNEDFLDMKVAITGCEYLIARTGSVLVSSAQNTSKKVYAYAPIHIVLAKTSQLVYDISDATKLMKDKYASNFPSMFSIISGPSFQIITENSEKKAIETKKMFVFLIN